MARNRDDHVKNFSFIPDDVTGPAVGHQHRPMTSPQVFPGKVKGELKVCNASILLPYDYFPATEKLKKMM
jgi:hypothetical protein